MKTLPCWRRLFVPLVILVGSLGCGSQIPVYPVHGKVLFEGKPLPGGGVIAFVPLTNQPGKTAGGDIAPDGTYRMTTHSPGDGSMVGEFRVVIIQATDREPERTPDGKKAPTVTATTIGPADRIPALYSDHQNSPLTARVEARSTNEIDFNLKRSAGPPAPANPGALRHVPVEPVALLTR